MRRALMVVASAAIITLVSMVALACDSFEEGDAITPPPDGSPDTTPIPTDDGGGSDGAVVDATAPAETYARVAAGDTHACAIRDDQVYCWGDNSSGAVGQGGEEPCIAVDAGTGDAGPPGTCRPTAKIVPGLEGKKIVEVAAGAHQTCARTAEHEVYCWGSNASQRLGVDNTVVPISTASPRLVPIPPAYSMSLGNGGGCARVLVDGRITAWCWGNDRSGELGRGLLAPDDAGAAPAREPAGIAWDAPIDQVLLGFSVGCARSGAEVRCWGSSIAGGTGHPAGLFGDVPCPFGIGHCNATPTRVEWPSPFARIELVGAAFACAFDDLAPRCWGTNYNGALGQGGFDNADHPLPATPNTLTAVTTNVSMMRGRYSHVCAVTNDLDAYCWGSNGAGELGHSGGAACGNMKCDGNAKKVGGGGKIVEIAVGYAFTVALLDDGAVTAWGTNSNGALGHPPGSKGDLDCPRVNDAVPAAKCNPTPRVVEFVK